MSKSKIKSNYYIQPEDFQNEYEKSLKLDEPTRKLLLMFEKIAKKYSTKFRCINKIDTDSCVNFALCEAWLKWKKYDSERSPNLFSFFTAVIKNDLMLHYNLINKNKDVNMSVDALFPNGH